MCVRWLVGCGADRDIERAKIGGGRLWVASSERRTSTAEDDVKVGVIHST